MSSIKAQLHHSVDRRRTPEPDKIMRLDRNIEIKIFIYYLLFIIYYLVYATSRFISAVMYRDSILKIIQYLGHESEQWGVQYLRHPTRIEGPRSNNVKTRQSTILT